MSDRGMKKWNAYRALPEHDVAVGGEKKNRKKVDKPKISSEEAEIINEILVNYHGEELTFTYYRNGFIYHLDDTIKKIDPYERKIITNNNGSITFSELVGLKRKE